MVGSIHYRFFKVDGHAIALRFTNNQIRLEQLILAVPQDNESPSDFVIDGPAPIVEERQSRGSSREGSPSRGREWRRRTKEITSSKPHQIYRISWQKRMFKRSAQQFSHIKHTSTRKMSLKNQLGNSTSPYLLQHKDNPVAWQVWGKESFKLAKDLNKPIFLSIGYHSCHWCHVMEKESFENEKIGQLINQHFIPIKMDREELPGPDKFYMAFQQLQNGSGGWPLNVWLLPNLQPFMAGTYFPPTSTYGQPAFPMVLHSLAKAWEVERSELEEQAAKAQEFFTNMQSTSSQPVNPSVAFKLAAEMIETYDEKWGGYGMAPKFPTPPLLLFLLNHLEMIPSSFEQLTDLKKWQILLAQSSPEGMKEAWEMAREQAQVAAFTAITTLLQISRGGIHDHISSGFHRYSVDREWHVPHFEKMLYDQAQLLQLFSLAWKLSDSVDGVSKEEKDELKMAAEDIITYVSRDLRKDGKGFYCAQDADSYPTNESLEKKEGAFAVWSKDEVDVLVKNAWILSGDDSLTPQEASDWFTQQFDIRPNGNVLGKDPHGQMRGKNVLRQMTPLHTSAKHRDVALFEKVITVGKNALAEKRRERPLPNLDDKILVSWNGLMIDGLSSAQILFSGDERCLELAYDVICFIRREMWDGERLFRVWRLGRVGDAPSVSDDYAFLIRGLLGFVKACSSKDAWNVKAKECLDWALELMMLVKSGFMDASTNAYFLVSQQKEDLHFEGVELPKCEGEGYTLVRMKDNQDGAEPTSNSVMAWNLLDLAEMTGDEKWLHEANLVIAAFGENINKFPRVMPMMVAASERAARRVLKV
jgi:uncharacterized protein YyaL (SSP411 family)